MVCKLWSPHPGTSDGNLLSLLVRPHSASTQRTRWKVFHICVSHCPKQGPHQISIWERAFWNATVRELLKKTWKNNLEGDSTFVHLFLLPSPSEPTTWFLWSWFATAWSFILAPSENARLEFFQHGLSRLIEIVCLKKETQQKVCFE